jgi:hypothetical protein
MPATTTPAFTPAASVRVSGDTWLFVPYAQYRLRAIDEVDTWSALSPLDVSDDELGAALRAALGASRMLTLDQAREYLHRDAVAARSQRWLDWAMARTGARNPRQVRWARSCSVTVRSGSVVEVMPMNRLRGDAYVSIGGPEEAILCPLKATDEALGQALRQGMERSIG